MTKQKIANTFGIEAMANRLLEYASEEELLRLIRSGAVTEPYLHVGAGSNLLFTKDYEGTVLHSRIQGIEVIRQDDDSVDVRVGAGVCWDGFVDYCVEQGWYGAENLSLIPGEVGASAVQNIGAYGVEAKDLILAVEAVSREGEQRLFSVGECAYAYRDSLFKRPDMKRWFITRVHYRLSRCERFTLDYGAIRQTLASFPSVTLKHVRQAIISIRRAKLPDPAQLGNAGSFFMNPIVARETFDPLLKQYPSMPHYLLEDGRVKIPAGWLIEQCGWKGRSLGRAAVYDKQALVLVNLGGATGTDIVALSDAVCRDVYRKFGISIHPEVNLI
ncbi:MAG: UDP-N-acetylmuramate dehydrogenase [Bacteroides sp.]